MKSDRLGLLSAVVDAARNRTPELTSLLEQAFPALLGPAVDEAAAETGNDPPVPGTRALMTPPTWDAVGVWGSEFLFAVKANATPMVSINGGPRMPMEQAPGTLYWFRLEQLATGVTHSYQWLIGERSFGPGDVAGYLPGSYEAANVPPGMLSEKQTIASSVYAGATADYWVYANAGTHADCAAPVMVWFDAESYLGVTDLFNYRLRTVSDNLVQQGLIPPMINILVSPSAGGEAPPGTMRSLQFDTVSGRYGRHIMDEILPDVSKTYTLRSDGYSRAAAGQSSGGICAFTLGWFHPDEFSRVHSAIGSFTGLQWDPEKQLLGGQVLPNLVRREPKRNLRVWMSEGMNDIDVDQNDNHNLYVAGSWPLNNIRLANALKVSGYDFHFRYGVAGHNSAQVGLDLPESLAWLWRDYDPERTEQDYEQDVDEMSQPIFRVQIANRSAW